MTQRSFPDSFKDLAARGHRKLLAALSDAEELAGGNVLAADAIGVDKGDLSKALSNQGRFMRTEWAMGLALATTYEARRKVALAFVTPIGFGIVDLEPVTGAEYEYELALLGPIGQQVIELARARKRGAL